MFFNGFESFLREEPINTSPHQKTTYTTNQPGFISGINKSVKSPHPPTTTIPYSPFVFFFFVSGMERDFPSFNSCRAEGSQQQQATTFVQAHTSNFKQVVQMLTGSPEIQKSVKTVSRGQLQQQQRKHGFKLYERRCRMKNSLIIASQQQHRKMPEILSPSLLDFPKLALSPVTPLIADPFCRAELDLVEEEKAIAERGFYLHPSSPLSTQEPKLLPLFPLTSPRSL